MSVVVPRGFRVAGAHCGLKRNPIKPDIALVVSDHDAVAAGVYTQNLVFAAPVAYDRARTPCGKMRIIVINSGNANACTGQKGLEDAGAMARVAAEAVGLSQEHALVLSTGVIGVFLPMEKISRGIQLAASRLANDAESLENAARGMLTTDTCHKLAGRSVTIGERTIQITGMAKGAAMIGPRMATMLGVLMTDAPLTAEAAQASLRDTVDDSFNCISVEGHMSTNDSVLLLANGAAGGEPLAGKELKTFQKALDDVCMELAQAIPSDGEGVTHLVTIDVTGCANRDAAHRIAKTVGESALVKAAIAGADPNWGRIVSAAGYAGVPLDPAKITLRLNGTLLYENGAPVPFDAKAVSASIRAKRDTSIKLDFGEGSSKVRFWTTDLTPEYVRLNADYTT